MSILSAQVEGIGITKKAIKRQIDIIALHISGGSGAGIERFA